MMSKSLEDLLGTSTVSELMLGGLLIVEGRALIPVVEVHTMVLPNLQVGWLAASPTAVVVVDIDGETAVTMTDEHVELTQLLNDLPDLATRIQLARERIAS